MWNGQDACKIVLQKIQDVKQAESNNIEKDIVKCIIQDLILYRKSSGKGDGVLPWQRMCSNLDKLTLLGVDVDLNRS